MVGINDQVGNYHIIEPINRGTFGSVYRGRHVVFGKDPNEPDVAIKLLHSHLVSPKNYQYFEQEAQILKKLKHPYILPIKDAGLHEESLYLVVEYASKGSLKKKLEYQEGKPLGFRESIKIISQVGEALQYAHQQKTVHRDLKPDNILFAKTGNALLADFGLAVVLSTDKTNEKSIAGTAPYMAPEQFKGIYSAKSDQYSLGIIAYELFTGRRPFITDGYESIIYHHMHVAPKPLRDYNANLPLHIERAVLKAMAKAEEERFPDVNAFIAALKSSRDTWIREGKNFFEHNCYEDALAAYELALQLDAKFAPLYNAKSLVLLHLEEYKKSLAACNQAIQLAPKYGVAYHNKGKALRGLKKEEQALEAYDKAIQLSPKEVDIYYDKGDLLSALGRYEEAIDAFNSAISLNPSSAKIYFAKGVALVKLKEPNYKEALAAYNQVIRLTPRDSRPYINKGIVLRIMGRSKDALAAYKEAIRLDPGNAVIYYSKGNALCDLERWSEALEAYEQAIRVNAGYERGYRGKATVLRTLGRLQEAQAAEDMANQLAVADKKEQLCNQQPNRV